MEAFADLVITELFVFLIGAMLVIILVFFMIKATRQKKLRESQAKAQQRVALHAMIEESRQKFKIHKIAGKLYINGRRILPESNRYYPNWRKFDREIKTLAKKMKIGQS